MYHLNCHRGGFAMQLTQTEMIQILRKRAGLNQAELGSRAFNTTIDSGRTKIKNIELGKQQATQDDLVRIAECLNVPLERLMAQNVNQSNIKAEIQGILISPAVRDLFPGLGEYLEMIEKAAVINDFDLIEYLSNKIADIWRDGPSQEIASPKK
jgi:transcriptional regulator with XRE-family HTH domain